MKKTEIKKKYRIDFSGRVPSIIRDEYLEKSFVLSESKLQSIVVEKTPEELDELLDAMNQISHDELKVIGVEDLSKVVAKAKLIATFEDDQPALYSVQQNTIQPSRSAAFTIDELVSMIQEDGDEFGDVKRFLTTSIDPFYFYIDKELLSSKLSKKNEQ